MTEENSPRTGAPLPVASAVEDARLGVAAVHYSARQAQFARGVLTRLYALDRAVRLYPPQHPAVGENVDLLGQAVRVFHDEGVELQLFFFQGEVLLGDQFLADESITFEKLIGQMEAAGVGSLTFLRGVAPDEIFRAGRILGAEPDEIAAAGGAIQMAEDADLPHIRFGIVKSAEYGTLRANGEQRAFLVFAGAVDLIQDMSDSLEHGGGADPLQVRGAVRSLVDGVLENRHSMLRLTGLKDFNQYTFYHSVNVAILSIALGSTISEHEDFLMMLGAGALLHDIGKLAVGREMLDKTGQLTPEEWEAMCTHPTAGAQMVSLMPGIDKAVLIPILEHHMRWDGCGYPVRTPIRRQHITSRVIEITDAYDAMTSRRAYSAARTQHEAISLIVQDAGSAFDPDLVRAFVRLMGIYPPHSIVRLSSEEVAIVIRPSDGDLLRPVVRIISTSEGELVDPVDVALEDREDLSIESGLDPRSLNIAAEDYF